MALEKNATTQISLPFEYSNKDIKPFAQQHWNITFAKQKKVSSMAKKMMTLVIAQISLKDDDFKPFYQMHVSDLAFGYSDQKSAYSEVKKAFNELTDLKWLIEDVENSRFAYRHLVNTSHIECGYNNGTITLAINPLLKDYFIALSHYSTYQLKWFMHFSSWYSMRLFELLSAFNDTGYWIVEIDEFRKLMDCEDKYLVSSANMLKKCLKEPLLELKNTPLEFTYETILEPKILGQKGRRPVGGVRFNLVKTKISQIPEAWLKSSELKKIIETLKVDWKVSELNIARYGKAIGLKGMKNLIDTWVKTDKSTIKRIDNRLSYCNSVFVTVGKSSLNE